jgi:YVTN family beta-propeller protein
LGNSVVTVFETQSQKVIKDIPDIGSVHGVLAVPELDRVYASATKTNEVVAIDEKTLKIIARIPGGTYPDGMAFAPSVNKLYVSDETGSTETVIDVSSNTRVATIAFGGEVGNTQYDSATKHIFVNVQGRSDLAEIDPASDKVSARYPLSGAKGNHGLLIDSLNRVAFADGHDAVLFQVYQQPGGNTVQVSRDIKAKLESLHNQIPGGVHLSNWTNKWTQNAARSRWAALKRPPDAS